MLPAQRAKYISDLIAAHDAVRVEELAQELGVSPITIRRDLVQLERQGLVCRTHGGAVRRNFMTSEERYDAKKNRNHSAKERIAQAAAALIPDGATVILDAGTSTFELARLLTHRQGITCVTYDLTIASEAAKGGLRTFIAGGEVQNSTLSAYGRSAEEFVARLSVDYAFLGVASVSEDGRLFTPTMEKASLKRAVMNAAQKTVLLADQSKFHRRSFAEICSLGDLDVLITDADVSPHWLDDVYASDIEVIAVASEKPEANRRPEYSAPVEGKEGGDIPANQ